MKVNYKRHIAKTISYRILSTILGFIMIWLLTGSYQVSAFFSTLELIWKPLQYYLHERIWYKYIKYGISKKDN